MTILKVKDIGNGQQTVSYPTAGHGDKTGADIALMLQNVSPGYVEYILQTGESHVHCSACRDMDCENQGNGDDACRAFKYGEDW